MENSLGFLRKLFSTILCCFLIVLAVSSCDMWANRAEILSQKELLGKLQEDIQKKKSELEETENQFTYVSNQITFINNQTKLLENAKIRIENTLRQPLLQTNIKYPLVRKDSLGEPTKRTVFGEKTPQGKKDSSDGWFQKKSAELYDQLKTLEPDWGSYNDDVLIVVNYDIDAKFRVDPYDIKLSKIDGNIVVSGIHPKYEISVEKTPLVREIRRRIYISGVLSSTNIKHDKDWITKARDNADKYEERFQQGLLAGTELPFMEASVTEIAKTFIKASLAPIYRDIKFDNVERPDSLSIVEFLQRELTDYNDRKNKLQDGNRNTASKNETPDEKIEQN